MGQDSKTTPAWMRPLILAFLVAQNTALAVFMRQSQHETREPYAATTCVFAAEMLKMLVSLLVQLKLDGSVGGLLRTLRSDVWEKPVELLKMAVPAVLYTLQNNLAYLAAANLDGPTYQLMYQLKILTTAIFSVTMLRRSLSATQWFSLLVLIVGVCTVESANPDSAAADAPPTGLPAGATAAHYAAAAHAAASSGGIASAFSRDGANAGAVASGLSINAMLGSELSGRTCGILAVLLACVTSGFAGVYFEKALKGSSVSLWVRNCELSAFGAVVAFIAVWLGDADDVTQRGWFGGYDALVWTSVALNSIGGLLVGLVVKHCDSVVKGFATSVSIVATSILSYALFAFDLTPTFMLGALLVLVATILYTANPSAPQPFRAAAENWLTLERPKNGAKNPNNGRRKLPPSPLPADGGFSGGGAGKAATLCLPVICAQAAAGGHGNGSNSSSSCCQHGALGRASSDGARNANGAPHVCRGGEGQMNGQRRSSTVRNVRGSGGGGGNRRGRSPPPQPLDEEEGGPVADSDNNGGTFEEVVVAEAPRRERALSLPVAASRSRNLLQVLQSGAVWAEIAPPQAVAEAMVEAMLV